MDRDEAPALLWGDGHNFAVLWAPNAAVVANLPETRGAVEFPSPRAMRIYGRTLGRSRQEGKQIVPCHQCPSRALSAEEVAAIIKSGHVSWERYPYWDYEAISGSDGKHCRFDLEERDPWGGWPIAYRLSTPLKEQLPPAAWLEILPLLPPDTADQVAGIAAAKRRRVPCLALLLAVPITAVAVFVVLRLL